MEEPKDNNKGISNRETATEEARERREHPSLTQVAQNRDAREREESQGEVPERQTSTKAGSRSIAQKESESKYTDRSAPPSRRVSGAYGRERDDETGEE